jgi:Tat protein secretion system quality control protein TatD with DNase activity
VCKFGGGRGGRGGAPPPPPPPPPPLALPEDGKTAPAGSALYVDSCVSLASRQFDRDREAVLRRARGAGVAALVVSSADAEKQKDVVDLCRGFDGTLYAAVGALPDNVKRTNEKVMAGWVESAVDAALVHSCVVAFQSGLDLTREPATHHAQEKLLEMHYAAARRVRLPLVLHVSPGSLQRTLELLASHADDSDSADPLPRVALFNGGVHAGDEAMDAWCAAGHWVSFTAASLSDPDAPGSAPVRAAIGRVLATHSRCMLSSGSPSFTPQTLPDAYLRTLRNEPSTLPTLASDALDACRHAGGAGAAESLVAAMWRSALDFYAIPEVAGANSQASASAEATQQQRVDGGSAAAAAAERASPQRAVPDDSESEEESYEETSAPAVTRSAFARLAVDEDDDADANEPPHAQEESHYACGRCRTALFPVGSVAHHTAGAGRDADVNQCLAHIFVRGIDSVDTLHLALEQQRTPEAAGDGDAGGDGDDEALPVHVSRLSCRKCGTKLGRFAMGPQSCGCGTLVDGPCVKLQASRLDFVGEALARSSVPLPGDEEGSDGGGGRAAPSRRKAPKAKRDNLRNLSSFRNKS